MQTVYKAKWKVRLELGLSVAQMRIRQQYHGITKSDKNMYTNKPK